MIFSPEGYKNFKYCSNIKLITPEIVSWCKDYPIGEKENTFSVKFVFQFDYKHEAIYFNNFDPYMVFNIVFAPDIIYNVLEE